MSSRTVVVADDLAERLTLHGLPLSEAVERTLRRALDAQAEGKPFWLERDASPGDLEDALRARVAQRRAGEDD